MLAIPGKEANLTANGVPLDSAPVQIEYAWGLFVLVAAAVALVINGAILLGRREERQLDEAEEAGAS
jgi:hypothetical protein